MQRVKRINVVTASDNHYLPMVAALAKSIEANLDKETHLDLWIIDDNIKGKNRMKMDNSVNPDITSLHWKKANEIIPPGFDLPLDKSTFPPNIFLWYYIPFFMPSEIGKVIYMDADMLNCRDLAELWNTNLEDKIAGAVSDPRIRTFDCDWGGVLNYKELGLSGNNVYFNSGILLIDVDKWRKNNITEKALDYVKQNINFAVFPDQYGANIALINNWQQLNPLWNFFASATYNTTPYNIHFVDRKPIYRAYKNNPLFRQQFYLYLQQTAWKDDFQPLSETRRYLKKLNNVFAKMKKKVFN